MMRLALLSAALLMGAFMLRRRVGPSGRGVGAPEPDDYAEPVPMTFESVLREIYEPMWRIPTPSLSFDDRRN